MKIVVVFFCLCVSAIAAYDTCHKDVQRACKITSRKFSTPLIKCSARYGGIKSIQEHLQKYVHHHLTRSFEYLLMSTYYSNYERNRPGFEKLFKDLSDDTWKEAIELIQYINKRGGEMNFSLTYDEVDDEEQDFEVYELQSIAQAVDMEKKLAADCFKIHGLATSWYYDPEVSYHLEEEFMGKQRDIIRKLSGYVTDLSSLLNNTDRSVALYFFDEYLRQQ